MSTYVRLTFSFTPRLILLEHFIAVHKILQGITQSYSSGTHKQNGLLKINGLRHGASMDSAIFPGIMRPTVVLENSYLRLD